MKVGLREWMKMGSNLNGFRVYDRFGFERGVVCGCEGDKLIYQGSGLIGRWQSKSEATLDEVDHVSHGSVWLNRDLRRYWELDQHDENADHDLERMARRA
jgi:hypothetical protein